MPIDSSIVGRLIQPNIQQYDPLESYGKSLTLANMMQKGDLEKLQVEEAVRKADANKRFTALFAGNPNATSREVMGIDPERGMALRKSELDAETARSTIGKNNASAAKDRFSTEMEKAERFGAVVGEARDQQSWDGVRRFSVVSGLLTPEQEAKLPREFTPEIVPMFQGAALKRAQQLADQRAREQQAETGRHNLATEGNTVRGQNLTAQVAREGHGVTVRGQNMTDARGRDLAQATRDAAATGRIPPGYRQTAGGNLEAIPGGPHDTKISDKAVEAGKTMAAYATARDGLLDGLEGASTGVLVGRIPAMTTSQQIASGGVAAMAPVLKQIFRVAGEGTFTDKDQELLMSMVPTRADSPGARDEKIANIDRIIAAKMGMPVPERKKRQQVSGKIDDVRSQADAILGGNY